MKHQDNEINVFIENFKANAFRVMNLKKWFLFYAEFVLKFSM